MQFLFAYDITTQLHGTFPSILEHEMKISPFYSWFVKTTHANGSFFQCGHYTKVEGLRSGGAQEEPVLQHETGNNPPFHHH